MKSPVFRFLFSLLCLVILALPLRAEDIADLLPATFTRVTSPDQLTADALYAFGAQSSTGKVKFMKAEILNGGNKGVGKLKALTGADPHGATYYLTNAWGMWRITYTEDGQKLTLTGAVSEKRLGRKTNGALGLTLGSAGIAQSEWVLETGPDGTFFLVDPTSAKRVLAHGGEDFDNYSAPDRKPTAALYIYKLGGSGEISGRATLPDDGARVALCNNGMVRTLNGTGTATSPLALCDETLADDGTIEVWTCRHTGDDCFVLESERGALAYDLKPTSAAAPQWKLAAGRFITLEPTPRTLCYNAATRNWTVTDQRGGLSEGLLAAVAPAPRREVSDKGVVTLTGGWTAAALAATDLADAQALDLTGATLPARPTAFATDLTQRNLPIFVSEAMATYAPAS